MNTQNIHDAAESIFGYISHKSTIRKAMDDYMDTPDGSDKERISFKHALSLCESLEEIDAFMGRTRDEELIEFALRKAIPLCETSEEAERAFNMAAEGSELQKLAVERWVELKKYESFMERRERRQRKLKILRYMNRN